MKNKVIGKIMVMSIIVAGLVKIFQDLFVGDSAMLTNVKVILLVISLAAALIIVSVMTWRMNKEKKNNVDSKY